MGFTVIALCDGISKAVPATAAMMVPFLVSQIDALEETEHNRKKIIRVADVCECCRRQQLLVARCYSVLISFQFHYLFGRSLMTILRNKQEQRFIMTYIPNEHIFHSNVASAAIAIL